MRGHIRKRGKSWAVVIFLGRGEQGRRRYKWYSHPTRREAQTHLNALLMQTQLGASLPPSRLKLGEYLEQWLQDYAPGRVRETTLRAYTYCVRHHISPELGAIPMLRITAPAIHAWLAKMQQKNLSPATVHQAFRVLRGALRQAVTWGMLPQSPVGMVRAPRVPTKEMRVWDEEQIRLFLAEAKRSSACYPLYLTAILTGMRQGELLALRWQDVDWTYGRASVRQTLVRVKGQTLFREPKSPRSRRTITLPAVVLEALRTVNADQGDIRSLLGTEYADHSLVFCQPNGKPLHAHNLVQRDFRRVAKRAGLPRIRFHDLRHTHATLLLREGVHPKVVQERLGHSQISTTLDTYSHVLPGMQEDAGRNLAARICRDLQTGGPQEEMPIAKP